MLSPSTCSSPTDISFSDSIYLELMAENIFTNQNNYSNQTKETNNTISNQLKALITNTKEISTLIISINDSLTERDNILDSISSLLESLKSDVNLLFKNDLLISLHKKQIKDTTQTYEEVINTTVSDIYSLYEYHIHLTGDPDSNPSIDVYTTDMSNIIQTIQQNLNILYNNINTLKEITNQKSLQQQFYSYTNTNTNNNNKPSARNLNFRQAALNPKSTKLKLSMSNELNDIRQLKDKDKHINESSNMMDNLQTYALKRYVFHILYTVIILYTSIYNRYYLLTILIYYIKPYMQSSSFARISTRFHHKLKYRAFYHWKALNNWDSATRIKEATLALTK